MDNNLSNETMLPGFEPSAEELAAAAEFDAPQANPEPTDAPNAGVTAPVPRWRRALYPLFINLTALVVGVAIGLLYSVITYEEPEEPQTATLTAIQESENVPVELLPDTADPTLWPVVASMHGEIADDNLTFRRGIAFTPDGTRYKVMLDFCRSGTNIYVKVEGDGLRTVKLNEEGAILRSYPCPENCKPLKALFPPPKNQAP